MSACKNRLEKELISLTNDPGPGVCAWLSDSNNALTAQIIGPEESPYDNIIFTLSIIIPDRYPFDPPIVRFVTPIYHPNIDNEGRICLDTLKPQPQGTWSPSVNINTLLLSIRLLMRYPNANDGLVPEITEEYKSNRLLWFQKARDFALLNEQSI